MKYCGPVRSPRARQVISLLLALLVVTFLAYVFDVWEPHVPIEHLPQFWSLPAHEFRAATGALASALADKPEPIAHLGRVGVVCIGCAIPAEIGSHRTGRDREGIGGVNQPAPGGGRRHRS